MPADRTVVTELCTALGLLGYERLAGAVADRSHRLDLGRAGWARLDHLVADPAHALDAAEAFDRGTTFLEARGGLGGRAPGLIEWTGGRRSPGDDVIPADLLVDHVLLVSCKYRSKVLHNAAPPRLFDDLLLASAAPRAAVDWFTEVALVEHQRLYAASRRVLGLESLTPAEVTELDPRARRRLKDARRARPEAYDCHEVTEAYGALVAAVAERTVARWRARLATRAVRERMLWRLLRIYGAPYVVIGTDERRAPLVARIGTPWDWRQRYRFSDLSVTARPAGQAVIGWTATYIDHHLERDGEVRGHVEIRWSHGPFAQAPEAKVYLDTPHRQVPGYEALVEDEAPEDPPSLW